MLESIAKAKQDLVTYMESTSRPVTKPITLPEIRPNLPPYDRKAKSKTAGIRHHAKKDYAEYTDEEKEIINLIRKQFKLPESYRYLASMPLWDRVTVMGTIWKRKTGEDDELQQDS